VFRVERLLVGLQPGDERTSKNAKNNFETYVHCTLGRFAGMPVLAPPIDIATH
jgi:hypothetical protein